jgi:hypothetical protein
MTLLRDALSSRPALHEGNGLVLNACNREKNILKGIGLESAMRTLIAVIVLAVSAQAISLKEFSAKTSSEQSAFVARFIDKMTTDLRAKNPQLAQDMRNWFAVKPEGKPTSEGMERLYIELTAIELQAREGKADLSKIQLESVIVWIAKQKFPPSAAAGR